MSPDPMGRRSAAVISVPFADGLLLHDPRRNEVHVLNATGALVWAACDGVTPVGDIAREYADASGHPLAEVEHGIRTHVSELRAAELIDCDPADAMPLVPTAASDTAVVVGPGRVRSPVLRVLDRDVVIGADDPGLVDELVGPFTDLVTGSASADLDIEIEIDVSREGTGLRVRGRGHDQVVADIDAAVEVVASLLNRLSAATPTMVAFHAGAVRSPEGAVVVLAGASGAGKSTLVAALVRAGWGYLTDEAVGLRTGTLRPVSYPKPLALDGRSRALVGLAASPRPMTAVSELRPGAAAPLGEAGRPVAVVIVDPAAGAGAGVPLAPADALARLAPYVLNLTASGRGGLESLAQLATEVPVLVLGERDLERAVSWTASLTRGDARKPSGR